jgi:hypothetical protein
MMVVAPERVGEALRHGGVLTILPEGQNDEFVVRQATYVAKVPAFQVAHDHSATVGRLGPACRIRAGDSRRDLDLGIESSAHALTKSLYCVIGNRYEHRQSRSRNCS